MSAKIQPKVFIQDIVFIVTGIFIAAFAMKSFLVPNHFIDGGVTGLALFSHEVWHWNLGLMLLVFNLPFMLLCFKQFSRYYAVKTFIAVCVLALVMHFIDFPMVTSDKLLISMFGGFFLGLGIGLAMRGGAAIDGLEILALLTLRKTSFTITELILGMNALLFTVAGLYFGIEVALYAMLTYFIAMKTIDYVIEGIQAYTGVTVISGKSDEIKKALVLNMGRGITVYKGERGFMKDSFEESHDCDIVFTVITRLEVKKLNEVVTAIDPKAFIFTNSIKETKGGILKRIISH